MKAKSLGIKSSKITLWELKAGKFRMKKQIISILLCGSIISACATSSANVTSSFVSPTEYASYDCSQIEAQMVAVSGHVREVAGAQDKKAQSDKVVMGVGLVLFWPALLFMASADHKAELSRLKGEYEALNTAGIQRKCNLVTK
jgi:hypothetical protein